MSESFYHILGIPTDADSREIKRAYHRLARELHPDKAASVDKAREVEQRFAVISKAYNVLKDPKSRADYDRRLNNSNASTTTSSIPRPQTATAAVMQGPRRGEAEASPAPKDGPSATAAKNGRGPEQPPAQKQNTADINLSSQRGAIAQKAFAKGVQLTKDKDFEKSVEFFDAAISNNPGEAAYYAYLALALVNAKKSASRAIEAAQKAIDLDTYNLDYRFTLAQIYETIGSKSNAIKIYEEILRWDENNVVAQQMLRSLKRKNNWLDKIATQSPILTTLRSKFGK